MALSKQTRDLRDSSLYPSIYTDRFKNDFSPMDTRLKNSSKNVWELKFVIEKTAQELLLGKVAVLFLLE